MEDTNTGGDSTPGNPSPTEGNRGRWKKNNMGITRKDSERERTEANLSRRKRFGRFAIRS